ncbi:hypothetical protein FOYG_10319 [Fusarium oxysporum NRRL 32931]|uniref:Uncharacterized protein n=1 Tax=Fusarium oxysporum NRRL 32931 TaxID=660029 RepID=W9I889_FUSOX|nr:hypothetical protein FOYG_10319 [Fusarium oxysporum NRRL 32931]
MKVGNSAHILKSCIVAKRPNIRGNGEEFQDGEFDFDEDIVRDGNNRIASRAIKAISRCQTQTQRSRRKRRMSVPALASYLHWQLRALFTFTLTRSWQSGCDQANRGIKKPPGLNTFISGKTTLSPLLTGSFLAMTAEVKP